MKGWAMTAMSITLALLVVLGVLAWMGFLYPRKYESLRIEDGSVEWRGQRLRRGVSTWVKVGSWELWGGGVVIGKGEYRNDKMIGRWEYYEANGKDLRLVEQYSPTGVYEGAENYKNGVLVDKLDMKSPPPNAGRGEDWTKDERPWKPEP